MKKNPNNWSQTSFKKSKADHWTSFGLDMLKNGGVFLDPKDYKSKALGFNANTIPGYLKDIGPIPAKFNLPKEKFHVMKTTEKQGAVPTNKC